MFPHPVVQTHTYSTYIIIYVVVRRRTSYQLYNILKGYVVQFHSRGAGLLLVRTRTVHIGMALLVVTEFSVMQLQGTLNNYILASYSYVTW